jgi:DNA (cytosine-5)-methyltransferase 1
MGDGIGPRLEGHAGHGDGDEGRAHTAGPVTEAGAAGDPGPTNGYWRDPDWLYCRDARWRPVEPGTFPLAHRAPQRVGRLRGYGNAIVAQAAAEVIRAYMESR